MKVSIAILLALTAVSISAAQAQEKQDPAQLGYFIGYHAAVLELENGHSFCISEKAMGALAAAIHAPASAIDAKKPAKGVAAALAAAFPCRGSDELVANFDSRELAQALLQVELTDEVAATEEFRSRHGLGMIVGTADLEEGRTVCMDGSSKKLSDALSEQQSKTPSSTLSLQFVLDALRAGYPCKR